MRVTVFVSGQLCEVPTDGLCDMDWRKVAPIRRFGFFATQRRNPGWLCSTSCGGRLIPYESRLELAHLLVLDFDPGVQWIAVQPLRIHWMDGRRARSHVPDLLVLREGLVPQLINIVHADRAEDPERLVRHQRAVQLAELNGLGCRRLVGGPPSQLLANLRALQSYRHRLTTDDLRARLLETVAAGASTIGEVEHVAGTTPQARAGLLCLIADGALECDLQRPVNEATVVRSTAAAWVEVPG